MLDAQERAAIERNREQALAIVHRLRAEAAERLPIALQSLGANAYAAGVEPQAASDPAATFWGRNVPRALDVLGKILSQELSQSRSTRDMRLIAEAAKATIKAAISADKNVLKAPGRISVPLDVSPCQVIYKIERGFRWGSENNFALLVAGSKPELPRIRERTLQPDFQIARRPRLRNAPWASSLLACTLTGVCTSGTMGIKMSGAVGVNQGRRRSTSSSNWDRIEQHGAKLTFK